MSESEAVGPEVLHAQLAAAGDEETKRMRATMFAAQERHALDSPMIREAMNLPAAALIASDSEEALNAPVKRRAVYAIPDRKASLAYALEEARVTAARTEDEDVLYQAFRSAARTLKDTEAAFKAASKAYAEAVGKLSDVVAK